MVMLIMITNTPKPSNIATGAQAINVLSNAMWSGLAPVVRLLTYTVFMTLL